MNEHCFLCGITSEKTPEKCLLEGETSGGSPVNLCAKCGQHCDWIVTMKSNSELRFRDLEEQCREEGLFQ